MHTVYIALGTNVGDRLANLEAALAALPPEVQVLSRSRIYETPAWGYEDQPDFLNMVARAKTDLSPEALLAHLKRLETELGRTPTFHWGPRLIDLDILFYDDLLLNTPQLTIPHPRLHQRAFVLVPLADLDPGLIHPRLGRNVAQLLSTVDVTGISPFSAASP